MTGVHTLTLLYSLPFFLPFISTFTGLFRVSIALITSTLVSVVTGRRIKKEIVCKPDHRVVLCCVVLAIGTRPLHPNTSSPNVNHSLDDGDVAVAVAAFASALATGEMTATSTEMSTRSPSVSQSLDSSLKSRHEAQ